MIDGLSIGFRSRSTRTTNARISRRRLASSRRPNGAIARIDSAETPDFLRGPHFSDACRDEIAKWRNAEQTWDMLHRSSDASRCQATSCGHDDAAAGADQADPADGARHAPWRRRTLRPPTDRSQSWRRRSSRKLNSDAKEPASLVARNSMTVVETKCCLAHCGGPIGSRQASALRPRILDARRSIAFKSTNDERRRATIRCLCGSSLLMSASTGADYVLADRIVAGAHADEHKRIVDDRSPTTISAPSASIGDGQPGSPNGRSRDASGRSQRAVFARVHATRGKWVRTGRDQLRVGHPRW